MPGLAGPNDSLYDACENPAGMPETPAPVGPPPLLLARLPGRASLAIAGADGATFLQGLVSQEMRGLAEGQGRWACLLTPKGKLRATMAVLRLAPDRLLLDADPELAVSLPGLFAEYALFHRTIALADETGSTAVLHLAGAGAAALLSSVFSIPAPSLPSPPLASVAAAARKAPGGPGTVEALLVAIDRGAGPGWDLRVAARDAGLLESLLSGQGAAARGPELLEPFRIASGIPRWGLELDETVLPDEAGLPATHVSYSKGCYVGQETVARLRTYGHVNRHLVRLSPGGASPLEAGSALHLPGEGAPGEAIGRVTSSAGRSALGWVKRGLEAPGTPLFEGVVEGPVGG